MNTAMFCEMLIEQISEKQEFTRSLIRQKYF